MVEKHLEKTPLHWIGEVIGWFYRRWDSISSGLYKIKRWFTQRGENREGKKYVNLQMIKGIMREYTQKSLYDLDEDLLVLKQELRVIESRRTVYTAVWKAGPLAIIPAASLTLSFSQILPSNNDYLLYFSLGLLGVILGLSIFSWRQSLSIDRKIGLIETRLEEIHKNIEDRVTAVRSSLLAYVQEMDRRPDLEDGYETSIFNDSLKTRIPLNVESRFGSRRISDISQRYPSIMSQIEVIEVEEGDFIESAKEYYDKAKSVVLMADHDFGINQSAQPSDRLDSNVRGLFMIYSRGIKTKDDVPDKKNSQNISGPELHFIQQVFEDRAFNPYANLLNHFELETIAKKVREEHDSFLMTYRRVRESIEYALVTLH